MLKTVKQIFANPTTLKLYIKGGGGVSVFFFLNLP